MVSSILQSSANDLASLGVGIPDGLMPHEAQPISPYVVSVSKIEHVMLRIKFRLIFPVSFRNSVNIPALLFAGSRVLVSETGFSVF